jgi:hypothetical protein
MISGGRYHQTKEGGSFHTDSPQWKEVPDFVGLYCITPAKKGGESKFVSAYSVHNKMLKEHKHFLEILYQRFHFDKRGEYKSNESPTVFEPIFSYNDNPSDEPPNSYNLKKHASNVGGPRGNYSENNTT